MELGLYKYRQIRFITTEIGSGGALVRNGISAFNFQIEQLNSGQIAPIKGSATTIKY